MNLDTLVSAIVSLQSKAEQTPVFSLATVDETDPIAVQMVGESEPIPVNEFFGTPKMGAVALCVIVDKRVYAIANTETSAEPSIPSGSIMEYAGNEAPPGWLICDGRQLRISDYPALYAVIGTRYGGAGGMFALPDHRGRVGVGYNQTNSDFNHLGKLGGSPTHTLTVNEMPRHDHYLNGGWGAGGMGTGSFRVDANNPRTRWTNTGHTGGNQPHNNLQPYITVNFIIKI